MLKRWQLWLGLIVSAVFLWLALRGLKLEEVVAGIREAGRQPLGVSTCAWVS